MERIYRGLMWVAGLAIVGGFLTIGWYWWNIYLQNTNGYSSAPLYDNSSDWFGYFIHVVTPVAISVIFDLLLGVGVFASVVAWADQRYRWLGAIVAATVLGIVAPFLLEYTNPLLYTHPRITAFVQQYSTELIFGCQMIPCSLAIAMTRTSPKWVAPLRQTRIEADAEIGITRTAL